MRKRFTSAAGVAALALLALPSLASAHPGTGPELVQRSGRLVVMQADRFDGTSTRQWALTTPGGQIPVRAPADLGIEPGSRVRLEGTMAHGELALADSQTAVTLLASAPVAAAAAPAMHTTAVILFGFTGGPDMSTLSITPGDASSLAFNQNRPDSLTSYYLEQTYGQIGFTGQVFGPYNINAPSSPCSNANLSTWAQQAKAAAGLTTSAYQHYVYVFPRQTPTSICPWSGLADIAGDDVWVNGEFSLRVIGHELGHNLGLYHAGGLSCTSAGVPSPLGDSCTTSDYGDPFDAMGGGTTVRQMSMLHKLALHLVPATAVKVVGGAGTYRIAPMETLTGAPEVLRVPKLGGGSYYVEYRAPIGFFDAQPPALSGVLIRMEGSSASSDFNAPDTLLIDMHATESPGNWGDAALSVGQGFSDAATGITIKNVAQDAAGATLEVTAPHDATPPSAPSGLTATANGTSVVLHWAAATDDFQVDSYVVTRDGAAIGTPATTDFTDTGLVPGTMVAYTVAAVDAGANVGPAVAASVAISDTTPPAAPPKVTATLTKQGKVRLSWQAATDNGRIAGYRVRRNGISIASGTTLSYVDAKPKPGSGSTVVYSVVARDLVGNSSAPAKAKPLRSALLRKLSASKLKLARVTVGLRTFLRVKGKLSDAKARCRLRVGTGGWHACKAKADGTFSVDLPPKATAPVTLSLRDALGRVKLQTLRVR